MMRRLNVLSFGLLVAFLSISVGSSKMTNATPLKATQKRVQVFFPNYSRNNNDLGRVEPVARITERSDVARFAIEQLIAGPTSGERSRGFMKALELRGRSNCGSDFRLSISGGVARLQFCRLVPSAGIGDDARATSSINATLKQFSTVSRVIILNQNGNCLGDQSGENRCLQAGGSR